MEFTAELCETLFTRSVLPIWIVDMDTMEFLAVNRAAVEIYGYQRETFLTSDLRLLRPNDSVTLLHDDYNSFLGSGKLHPRRHRQADGHWANVQVAVNPVNFNGRRAGLAQVLHTELGRSAEEEVRKVKQRMAHVLSGALDAVISIDRDSHITEWSGESESIFGWSAEEAIGQPMHELIMPERFREQHLLGLHRYFVTGQAKLLGNRVEVHAIKKSGEEFPAELRIMRVDRSSTFDFTAFLRDLTPPNP